MTQSVAPQAYVNGAFIPLAEARISVLDRGFLFADGVYEVTAVLDGRMVDGPAHLARLERSLGELALRMPESPERIVELHHELIERASLAEGLVYLQITRGAGAERDFAFPKDAKPSLVMFTQAKALRDNPAAIKGTAVKTVADIRWGRRDIKSVMLLAQVIAKHEATMAGAHDAWLVEPDGTVTESASSTAFIVEGGTIRTRANSTHILPGCTSQAVRRLALERGMQVEERAFTLAEAQGADEAFSTSATSFVLPVVSIDNRPVGNGLPGPVTRRLREIYLEIAGETDS